MRQAIVLVLAALLIGPLVIGLGGCAPKMKTNTINQFNAEYDRVKGQGYQIQPGDTLDDFQLLSTLGSGAFARVFLARQKSMERMVALKVSTHAGSEPQTLAQLDHPHIVRVYDQRTVTDPPAKLLYMEVVSGGTLQDVIARTRHAYDGKPSGDLLLASIDEKLAATGTPIPESSSSRAWTRAAA